MQDPASTTESSFESIRGSPLIAQLASGSACYAAIRAPGEVPHAAACLTHDCGDPDTPIMPIIDVHGPPINA